ncbi:hypothetical protein HZS_5685 [Henneguya salminicola]|nr:hypothetical protein HZS_5685 [Henneguya salminicola]
MLCERFIRIYENFTGLLEKEANKSIEKQMIGRLYMNLNAVLFNFILNYCQFHSYFIQTILQNKLFSRLCKNRTVINSAKQSNEIQSNLMSFITFFSSPFLRMNSISLLLKEIGEKLENNLQELSQTLIHHISVHPSSVSFEEDCKFYFLIFNNKKLLYGYLQSASNPQTFKLIDIFIVKNTKLESIADRENLFNLIDVSDSESNKKLELVTEGSNEKKFILDLFQKIKEGKNYLPFWFDKKIVLLTIPSIPIQRTIMRVTNRNQNSIGNEENRINYKLLASILSNTMGVPRHSLIRTESKQMEELNFLTERVRKLEELVNEMNRKLEHNVRKGNNLEEIIKRLIKLPK